LNKIQIHHETQDNIDAIDLLNREAFGSEDEPKLIKQLRERNELLISLVAMYGDSLVGYVCASRVFVEGTDYSIAGIGPLAVSESHRKQGIGAMLMKEVIEQLRTDGCIAAVLLGDPNYYPRFGFHTASQFKLDNEYNATDAFMAMELQPTSLDAISGVVQYSPAFSLCDS
jgi:putative acetyltransferase